MPATPAVFLKGRRLYLRAIEDPDLELCRRWVNDPEIRPFILGQTPIDEIAEQKWHESRGRGAFPEDIVFAIVLRKSHRHIGNMGLHHINWINRNAVSGAIIGEADCRNRGYGGEAKTLMLGYAFDTLGLHRISSRVLATNARSLAYLK